MTLEDWINDVDGKPWVDRADGPDAFDCWGLVLDYFRRVRGTELTDLNGYKDGLPFNDCLEWAKLNGAAMPCDQQYALVFTRMINGEATHVGIMDGGLVVHSLGTPSHGGQVHVHTMRHIRRLFKNDTLEFWTCQ